MEKKIVSITSKEEIKAVLNQFSDSLHTLSSGLVNSDVLAEKYYNNAKVIALKAIDNVLGFAAFYCNNVESKEAFLSTIAVDSKYRNEGIGTMLMQEVISISQSAGMNTLLLEVKEDNLNARRFYEGHGMLITSQKTNDTLFMLKKLN